MKMLITSQVENLGDQIVNLGESSRVTCFTQLIASKFKKAMDVAIILSPFGSLFRMGHSLLVATSFLANFLGRVLR